MKRKQSLEKSAYIILLIVSLITLLVIGNTEGAAQAFLIGVCSSIFTTAILYFFLKYLVWQEMSKVNSQHIPIILCNGGKKKELPLKFRLSDLTRAEVLGRIGMLPMKKSGQRFEISYLNTPEFIGNINRIRDNYGNEGLMLEISCNDEEFDQFNFDKLSVNSN